MQNLLQYISTRCFVDPALRERLQNDFEEIEVKKGSVLLESDQRAVNLFFIDKGLVHNYYYRDHKRVSSWFYNENQFSTAWYSFYSQQASFEYIEALEDTVLYQISHAKYQKLIADFPAFGNFARLLAEENLSFLDYFSKGWAFMSAKEKYELLLSYFPDIELRVKIGLIASFLGISQETLSRIRGK